MARCSHCFNACVCRIHRQSPPSLCRSSPSSTQQHNATLSMQWSLCSWYVPAAHEHLALHVVCAAGVPLTLVHWAVLGQRLIQWHDICTMSDDALVYGVYRAMHGAATVSVTSGNVARAAVSAQERAKRRSAASRRSSRRSNTSMISHVTGTHVCLEGQASGGSPKSRRRVTMSRCCTQIRSRKHGAGC